MILIHEQSQLFLQHVLLYHLENHQIREAVAFASHYKQLVFFAHALEMLLHTVVESDVGATSNKETTDDDIPSETLPAVIEFLDHFDSSLDVVVGCARKTELTRWKHLFSVVGNPKVLFEVGFFKFIPSVYPDPSLRLACHSTS